MYSKRKVKRYLQMIRTKKSISQKKVIDKHFFLVYWIKYVLVIRLQGKKMSGQFVIKPVRSLEDRRLKPIDRNILDVLQRRSSDKGYCWPAYNRIAEDCGICRRSAIYSVKRLVEFGYLIKSKRTIGDTDEQTSNTYFIKFDPE